MDEELPARRAVDANGALKKELAELAPKGHRRMSDNPHTNGGLLLKDLRLPTFAIMPSKSKAPARPWPRLPDCRANSSET